MLHWLKWFRDKISLRVVNLLTQTTEDIRLERLHLILTDAALAIDGRPSHMHLKLTVVMNFVSVCSSFSLLQIRNIIKAGRF